MQAGLPPGLPLSLKCRQQATPAHLAAAKPVVQSVRIVTEI